MPMDDLLWIGIMLGLALLSLAYITLAERA